MYEVGWKSFDQLTDKKETRPRITAEAEAEAERQLQRKPQAYGKVGGGDG